MLQINKRVSFYKNKVITDDMIMTSVGVVTYKYLCVKFPYWFYYYKECSEIITPLEGNIPSEINLYISNNPYEIKKDLILSLCNEKIVSNNLNLLNSTCKPNYPLLEENSVYSWIFICIVMILLILLSIFIIYNL